MKTLVESAKAAKAASLELARLTTEAKNAALRAMARALMEKSPEILAANEADMQRGREGGMPESLLDRLMLNEARIAGMAATTGAPWIPDAAQQFPERYDHPDYEVPEVMFVWGNYPLKSNIEGFYGHWVIDLMKRGMKTVVIDPRVTFLAAKADLHLPIRPGTDAALALAIVVSLAVFKMGKPARKLTRSTAWVAALIAVVVAVVSMMYGGFKTVLDLAAGTGASSAALAKGGAEVVACDLSEGMIEVGRERHPEIEFVHGNAMDLDFEDGSFDAVTISWGLRNIPDPQLALREMARVVRPRGRLVVLEFSTPPSRVFRGMYNVYQSTVMPAIARLASTNDGAYDYLVESIRQWPAQEEIARMVAANGWSEVEYRNLTGGIACMHRAVKPLP